MGGKLSDRDITFNKEYINRLETYKPSFQIVTHTPAFNFVFQDLTYLQDDEIGMLPKENRYLFVTNKKQHLHYFDGANYSLLGEYYLIWR